MSNTPVDLSQVSGQDGDSASESAERGPLIVEQTLELGQELALGILQLKYLIVQGLGSSVDGLPGVQDVTTARHKRDENQPPADLARPYT